MSDKIMTEDTAIEQITIAKKALMEARSLAEVLDVRDVAVAAYAYATARNADEAAQIAIEIKLRAERKAGEFLQEAKEKGQIKRGGDQAKSRDVTLSSLGISKMESSRWQLLASLSEERFEVCLAKASTRSQSAILRLAKGAHVGHSTGEFEWYTPRNIIEAARKLMKTIDVDPASSDMANQIIKATTYYTIEDDGLNHEWRGNVWMNPPFSQPLVTQFCNLLVEKYLTGEINQACVLVNNATETEFYQNMMKYCKAICFIKGRVNFIDKEGNSTGIPLQGQTILYFGDNTTDFNFIFSEFGVILYAQQ